MAWTNSLALLNSACLSTFGDACIFRDPNGVIADTEVAVIFSERDVAEPPGNMGASKGQYSSAWTALSLLPVADPTGYQIIEGGISGASYWVRQATNDGGAGVNMKLHKVRP